MKKVNDTKIKICGLSRKEDIEAINEAKPDYCGFIVNFPKSHRNISVEQLIDLTQMLNKEIIPVGVFVNEKIEVIEQLLNDGVIGMAQLHGKENEEYISELKKRTSKPIIKAFSMKSKEDARIAQNSSADYVLLDQGNGGTGETFSWELAEIVTRPFFLAGGLNRNNLRMAIENVRPWAVDISSGVETEKLKDKKKILEAIRLVRE